MDIRLLGPVEASVDDRAVAVAPGKPRALLAMLALHAGSTVSSDRLIEGLWGERPPATAPKLVQLHVSALRKAFAASGAQAPIRTRGHGYELQVRDDDVDVRRFERLVAGGRSREALALWRGPALDDVANEPFAAAQIRRLEELRMGAVELAVDRDLDAGRHRDVLGELETLVLEAPLREHLHAQLMLALYRGGRQAEALEAYQRARAALVEQVGVEPGPELRRTQDAILRQDPSLDAAPPAADVGGEAAQRHVAGRVGGAAARIAAERPGLRAAEDDLAGDVVELQAARERAARERPSSATAVVCPFKGLAAFDVDDAAFFSGRERLVAEMVARIPGATLVGIVGPSGSGKSSALRAGLLAALAGGVLPGSERWGLALLRPGEHPVEALEQAIGGAACAQRLVVAVDQFEELFTSCRDEEERSRFVAALVVRARDVRGRSLVLLAVRADFYGRCAAYPELARLLGAGHVLVGPMRRDELRRAVERPARRAGLCVEPDLVDELVAGTECEPGALPLLQTALLELWQRRDGRTLRLADLERLGGVAGAVTRLAERAYDRLDAGQRDVARRILLRLAGDGEGDAVVRRRVPLAEFDAQHAGGGVAHVLAVLADDRLVTVGRGEVEVAHEALLREWPRLRAWLHEDAEGRRLRRHLESAAEDWRSGGRPASELYRGARLVSALEWRGAHDRELGAVEREFLAASETEAEVESERQRRANRRLRGLLAGFAALLALAVAAGVVALAQRGEARDALVVADAQRLGAQALTTDRLDSALLLARTGTMLADTAATRSSLLSVLQRDPAQLGTLPIGGWALWTVDVSPDGRLVAVAGQHGEVTVFDAARRRPVGPPYVLSTSGGVQSVRFSPQSSVLAVAGFERAGARSLVVHLVDVRTGRRRHRVVLPHHPSRTPLVGGLEFLAGGRRLAFLLTHLDSLGPPASVLGQLDVRTGELEERRLAVGRGASRGLAATADGRRLFVVVPQDDASFEVDPDDLRVVRRRAAGGVAGDVAPGGRVLALGAGDGAVRLLDLVSGRLRRLDGRHDGAVVRMRFTPDGRTLVTSGADGRVLVWDVAAGGVRETLSGHVEGVVWGLTVSSDGRMAYSAGDDGRVVAWDLSGERRLFRPFPAGSPFGTEDGGTYPVEPEISPDGRALALAQADGTVELLDARTFTSRGRVRALRGFAAAAGFSPDGRLLAVSGEGGQVTLLDARTLRRTGPDLEGLRTTSQALAFSPDSRLLAVAALGVEVPEQGAFEGGEVRVWDVRRRARTRLRFEVTSASLAFSPDGRLLAAATHFDRTTDIRDTRTGRLVARLPAQEVARSVAFSGDGDLVATGEYDGTVRLWSTRTWQPAGPPLEAHEARVVTLAFSPGDALLASASEDGTVALWDVATRHPVGSPLRLGDDRWVSAAFTPDGAQVVAVSNDGHGLRFPTSPAAWARHACRVAGRELSASEWADALPDHPRRAVCGG